MHPSIYAFTHPFIRPPTYYLSHSYSPIHPPTHPFIFNPHTHPPIKPSTIYPLIHPFAHTSVHPPKNHPFTNPPICLSLHQPIHWSIHLPTQFTPIQSVWPCIRLHNHQVKKSPFPFIFVLKHSQMGSSYQNPLFCTTVKGLMHRLLHFFYWLFAQAVGMQQRPWAACQKSTFFSPSWTQSWRVSPCLPCDYLSYKAELQLQEV